MLPVWQLEAGEMLAGPPRPPAGEANGLVVKLPLFQGQLANEVFKKVKIVKRSQKVYIKPTLRQCFVTHFYFGFTI